MFSVNSNYFISLVDNIENNFYPQTPLNRLVSPYKLADP